MQLLITPPRLMSWRKLALSLAAITTFGGMQAQTSLTSMGMEPAGYEALPTIAANTPAASRVVTTDHMQAVGSNARLIDAAQAGKSASPVTARAAKARTKATAADFTGSWIMTTSSLLEGRNGCGGELIIESTTTAGGYILKNFWQQNLEVAAHIDVATGKITIPNQVFAQFTDGTKIDVTALVPSSGAADRATPITGQLNADGSITFDTWWGIYDASKNTIADNGLYGAYYETRMVRPNGTLTFTQNNVIESMPIYANQVAGNVLEVTNILNGGQTIEMTLNRNLTATITMQPILSNNGFTYHICNAVIEGTDVSFTTPITTDVATDRKVISWTNWTGYGRNANNQPGWVGLFTDTKLTFDFEVNYPTISTTSLQGKGTKESPWLITSKDDLLYMSDMVNSMDGNHSKNMLCSGEYFRLENDIDMSGYRFTAIACDYDHVFNGIFDGNGHTISGLTLNGSTYGALIGRAGEQSLVTNLTIKDANIKASAFAGCVVAWTAGDISNVNVVSSTIVNSSNGVGAIANIVRNITNCHADMCNVSGSAGYVGGLVGQLNGTMTNCSATNMRIEAGSPSTGPSPAGGLIALANFQSVATDSYFSGTIDASYTRTACIAGGIAGLISGATIERCFAVGTIRGYTSDAYTGGIAGQATSGTVIDCYVNGRIDNPSSRRTGGLIGFVNNGTLEGAVLPGTVRNCYTSAALTAETYLYNPDTERRELFGMTAEGSQYTIENVYFNKQLVNFGSTQYGLMTSDFVSANGLAGFPADKWEFTQGQYPRLKGIDQNQAAFYSASALIMNPNSSLDKLSANAAFNAMGNTDFGYLRNGQIVKDGYYSKVVGDSIILNDTYTSGTDTMFIVNGRAQYHYFVKVAPIPFEGEGTQEKPYLIRTKNDLIQLSKITTVNRQAFPGTYFKMTNDIDLEYSEEFLGIAAIGSSTFSFAGIFDGGGYAVHKMRIHQVNWLTKPTDTSLGTVDAKSTSYLGFIGTLAGNGVVRNLTIAADCDLTVNGYSGAVVGYNFGRIENCRNYADLTVYAGTYVGGITGYNNNVETAIIENCFNAGNITSGRYGIGGITGVNYSLIRNCVNTGNIVAKVLTKSYTADKNYLVGGITGSLNGRLDNCVNYGTVAGNNRIGGLSGSIDAWTSGTYHNDVVNCLNFGIVYGTDAARTGAMGGATGSTGTIANNHWDAQILPLAANANTTMAGMTGMETSVLTSGNAIDGFDTAIWDFTAGMYPALKAWANEATVQQARAIVMTLPANKNAYDMTGLQATLSAAEGLTWRMAQGKEFSISSNTLTGPATVSELVTDTLYASYGNLVKPILLKSMPSMPLAGTGTEADPYQISTTADWAALATYMTQTSRNLEGEFVVITADIDFTGATFTPLAADGATYFNGTLDGKGHTIKGIKFTTKSTFGGAIGVVGATGTVKNLTMEGAITSAQASTGGFTGKLYGALENCVNAISITSTKATVGGFAATMYGTASVTDCVNKANLSGVSSVGGIAGTFDASSKVTLTRAGNEGTIKGNTGSTYVGGLVGTAYPSTFTDCYNYGTVTVNTPTSQSFAAGLIGFANGVKEAAPYVITGCRNTGAVTAKSGVAGIVSNVSGSAGYTILHITDCHNSGALTAKGTANTSNSANAGIAAMVTPGSILRNCHNTGNITVGTNNNTGGITGYARVAGTASQPIRIIGCSNSGSIKSASYQIGGIAGNIAAYTYVDSCYNTGSITGTGTASIYAVGGISGAINNPNAAITNSWNTGDIIATNRIGGIAGMNNSKAAITDCWNGGNISSSSTTQGLGSSAGYGIGGVAGQCSSIITRCYNYGTVKGAGRTGGLVGAPTKNNTQLVNCYNAGRIDAPADSCGNLVGINTLNNGSIWNTGNAITDSYYVTDFGIFANTGTLGTAVTMAELAKTDLGADWTIPADYSLPVVTKYADCNEAMLYSAAVVLGADNTFDNVTTGFNLGTPAGVQWTASASELTIEGNTAKFNSAYTGDIVLTATLGELSRTVTIKANVTTTGIDAIDANGNEYEAEYFNLQGVRVLNPTPGHIYIVRRGSKATKELYR